MRGGAAARGGGGAGVGVVTAPRLKQPFNPAAPTFGSNLASIEGVIKEIIDYNESNGFTVCILRASEVVPILDTRVNAHNFNNTHFRGIKYIYIYIFFFLLLSPPSLFFFW